MMKKGENQERHEGDEKSSLPDYDSLAVLPPFEIGARAFAFAVRIVKLCQSLDVNKGVSKVVSNQLLKAGTSIGANLEESKGGQSRADYLSKVSIALKEARETHYWLRLIVATELLPEKQLSLLIDESNQLVAILTTIVKQLKS